MRTLFLHVGHGKTGSTYLQGAFRARRGELERHGIVYAHGPDGDRTEPTAITAGNAAEMAASPEALAAGIRAAAREAAGRSALLSSELLFDRLAAWRDLRFLPAASRDAGFGRVALLLFIRDPLDDAASNWQQAVKIHGHAGSIEDWYLHRYDRTERAADLLAETRGVETTVLNYSRCADRLLEATSAWLGLPAPLEPLAVGRVNRSLAPGELVLQRALNEVLGRSGHLLAERLCTRLPDVPVPPTRPPRAVQEATRARLRPAIERVAARVPEAQRYRCELVPDAPSGAHPLSDDQLRVIAEELGGELSRLGERVARLGADRERLRARLASYEADATRAASGRQLLRALARRGLDRLRGRRRADAPGGAGPS